MNKIPIHNMASITASTWLSDTLKAELVNQHITKYDLARVANVDRRTIDRWINGFRSPKLEYIAQIFSALGYESITIPLKEVYKDGSQG